MATFAVAALLIFVIPVFANMFKDFGAELPGPTKVVVNLSNFLKTPSKILPIIAFLVIGGFAFFLACLTRAPMTFFLATC